MDELAPCEEKIWEKKNPFQKSKDIATDLYLNLMTIVTDTFPLQQYMQIVVHSRFKKASKVCNFHYDKSAIS
jgi:hypothetical protein